MGHRANLIIIRERTYSLYYSHWCAITLPSDLFWGPEAAVEFIEQQEPAEGWLDNAWAEGGALVDLDRQYLLWYGGEDVKYEIPLRRHLLKMMLPLWPGWTMEWASAGILDMGAYIGYPLEKLYSKNSRTVTPLKLESEPKDGWVRLVASVVYLDGELRLYPVQSELEDYLLQGPQLVESLEKSAGFPELDLNEWPQETPDQGFHLNLPDKAIDVWYAPDAGTLLQQLREAWPGWKVTDHKDRYEAQVRLTEGKLLFKKDNPGELTECLTSYLLRSHSSPIDVIKQIVQLKEEAGENIEVNPHALVDEPQDIPQDTREQLLRYAIANMALE
ncbi:hypothetical protein GCM10010912_36900 [Paenibacillus albidus]|uniref:Uncharacterized protein n=1 Tax=Paenibacillus albidus TaxID=2041023 RepID=A0A917CI72_9BACL|nr:hypothetical protein [Paenibacillus albidus]GGF88261.1 hypothetical protein GCM10010912_36900 [Paenibacillus albidus]